MNPQERMEAVKVAVADATALAETLSPIEALSVLKCQVDHLKKVNNGLVQVILAMGQPPELAEIQCSLAGSILALDAVGPKLIPGTPKLDHSACDALNAVCNRVQNLLSGKQS